jgi:hypothetical protein
VVSDSTLTKARTGDEQAFQELTDPPPRELTTARHLDTGHRERPTTDAHTFAPIANRENTMNYAYLLGLARIDGRRRDAARRTSDEAPLNGDHRRREVPRETQDVPGSRARLRPREPRRYKLAVRGARREGWGCE